MFKCWFCFTTGAWPEDEKFEMDIASFARLDVNAILEFQKMYQGSEEERQDIKKFYVEGKGDLGHICDNVFFLNILDDEERVNSIIESLIEAKEVERLSTGKKNEKALERKKKKVILQYYIDHLNVSMDNLYEICLKGGEGSTRS